MKYLKIFKDSIDKNSLNKIYRIVIRNCKGKVYIIWSYYIVYTVYYSLSSSSLEHL